MLHFLGLNHSYQFSVSKCRFVIYNLNFKKHIDNFVCKALFLTIEKAKILDNAFIDSQFNYAPLILMFCRKTFYSKIQFLNLKPKLEIWEVLGMFNLQVN